MLTGVIVVSVGSIVLLSPVIDWAFGSHDFASYEISLTTDVDICPSVPYPVGKPERSAYVQLSRAVVKYSEHTDCKNAMPKINLDNCSGPVIPGHVRVRGCSDLSSPVLLGGKKYQVAGCPPGFDDTFEKHPYIAGAGVLFWDIQNDMPNSAEHVIGHISGIGNRREDGTDGHATGATSWMHNKPGSLPSFISCEI